MTPTPAATSRAEAKPDSEWLKMFAKQGLTYENKIPPRTITFLHGLEALGLLRSEMVRTGAEDGKDILTRTFYPVEASPTSTKSDGGGGNADAEI